MKKQYSELEAINSLRKKKDIRISGHAIAILKDRIFSPREMATITNPIKSFDLGNGSWGKIDYLTKERGYYLFFTDKF